MKLPQQHVSFPRPYLEINRAPVNNQNENAAKCLSLVAFVVIVKLDVMELVPRADRAKERKWDLSCTMKTQQKQRGENFQT
jgi:hypothetical protein